jgi:hypothetical protein
MMKDVSDTGVSWMVELDELIKVELPISGTQRKFGVMRVGSVYTGIEQLNAAGRY